MEQLELMELQAENFRLGKAYACVTVVHSERMARTSGKMLVYPDGTIKGTVGGGPWEQAAVHDALRALDEGKNAVKTYDFTGEMAAAGYHCDGVLTVFIECCREEKPDLIVLGGGHVGAAVIRLARSVGFRITLIDTRAESEIAESVAMADRFLHVDRFDAAEALELPQNAFYIVSTYGHMVDGAALGGVLRRGDAAYVGMLGSKRKVEAIFAKLEASGIPRSTLSKVRSPIGLDIGGETPEELAISIMAQILAVKNGKSGGHISK